MQHNNLSRAADKFHPIQTKWWSEENTKVWVTLKEEKGFNQSSNASSFSPQLFSDDLITLKKKPQGISFPAIMFQEFQNFEV